MRVVAGEFLKQLRHVNVGLVADGKDAGERQGAAGEGEVAGDVARLGDDGNAPVDDFHAMFVGPGGDAGEAVHEAVAIGTHQRHAVRCREQFLLEVGIACFGEPAGIDHRPAAALFPQFTDDFDGGFALDGNEGGIGRAVDFGNRSDAGNAAEAFALGVDGPDFSGKAQFAGAADRDFAFIAADEDDGLGVEQGREGTGHSIDSYLALSPCGRRWHAAKRRPEEGSLPQLPLPPHWRSVTLSHKGRGQV